METSTKERKSFLLWLCWQPIGVGNGATAMSWSVLNSRCACAMEMDDQTKAIYDLATG